MGCYILMKVYDFVYDDNYDGKLFIWNPCTKDCIMLPPTLHRLNFMANLESSNFSTIGFGCESTTNDDYKGYFSRVS
ncbi:hypothetical protein Sjap_019039 [Stephania japonica]|uniref:Uncharacterized protein n=1 Tax=Stephania japonica TaxID=461633 RepID=A0AAP0EXZ1_9MAGN